MNRLTFVLLVFAVIATALWTYTVTYRTTDALERVSSLRGRIAEEREAVQVLAVEWAWLNRPERLSALAAKHHERLGLVPLTPESFDTVASVPFPPPPSADASAEGSAVANRGRRAPQEGGVSGPARAGIQAAAVRP